MHRKSLMVIMLTMITLVSYGQQLSDTVLVLFPKEGATFRADYKGNGERLDAFFARAQAMAGLADRAVCHIQAIGTASPEGQYRFNEIVAGRRQESVARHLKKHYGLTEAVLECSTIAEDWDFLMELIKKDPKVTSKDRILATIAQAGAKEAFDDATVQELLKIEWSRPYWYIYHNIFPKLRACRIIYTFSIEGLVDEVTFEDEMETDTLFIRDIDFSDLPVDTLPTFAPARKKHFIRSGKQARTRAEKEKARRKDKTQRAERARKVRERKPKDGIAHGSAGISVPPPTTAVSPLAKPDDNKSDIVTKPVVKDSVVAEPVVSEQYEEKTVVKDTVAKETESEKTVVKDSVVTEPIIKETVTEEPAPRQEVVKDHKKAKVERQKLTTIPLTLKANAIGYAIGVANIAVETGLTERLSFALPFYYSGLNYFKKTLKFRVCTLQPELRYNFRKVKGLYAGLHLGFGWFNYALDGPYRIQDAGGKRPAWGGGLGVGYRMPFRQAPEWGLEFALGAGVYDARYDMLYNEENGPYYRTGIRKTWGGIDNASVAVTYRFDIKRGGRR